MKRYLFGGLAGFCLGLLVMGFTVHLSADEQAQGIFVRVTDMEWKGQESHGPKTALKWILGRESSVKMAAMESFWITSIGAKGFNTPHTNAGEEQIYYILEGEGRMVIGDKEYPAKAGDAGYFPNGVKHGFYNDGDKPAMFLGIGTKVADGKGK